MTRGVAGVYLKGEFLVVSVVNLRKGSTFRSRVPSSSYSIILLILLFLFNYPDDNLDDTAASHYGDDTAPSPNIIFVYEVILVWGFSLY